MTIAASDVGRPQTSRYADDAQAADPRSAKRGLRKPRSMPP